MKNQRKGQAFVIVVIIIALVLSLMALSSSILSRSTSLRSVSLYQTEQALYLAQTGINQMIYNMNNGIVYSSGNSITGSDSFGLGNYTTYYYEPDNYGVGDGYLKSTGKVGEFERVVFYSIRKLTATSFKYTLFTLSTISLGEINAQNSFSNNHYGSSFIKNTVEPGVTQLPYPDMAAYKLEAQTSGVYISTTSFNYTIDETLLRDTGTYGKKLIYVEFNDPWGFGGWITLNFRNAPNLTQYHFSIVSNGGIDFEQPNNRTIYLNPPSTSKWNYPIFLTYRATPALIDHYIDFIRGSNNTRTIVNGFIYSNSRIDNSTNRPLTINGSLMQKDLETSNFTNITADYIYYNELGLQTGLDIKPPPYFTDPNSAGSGVTGISGTFREEY